jgi:peptide/nickel transport system permease protein
MSFVFLWTDALIWLLVVAAAAYFIYVRDHEHLSAPWRRLLQSGAAMACMCILALYLVIGLLDCLHFHPRLPRGGDQPAARTEYSVEVRSPLDVLLTRLREARERTYSAPLAVYAFSKETIDLPGGKTTRDYPRLRYGGAQLHDPAERAGDLLVRAARGGGVGALVWAVAAAFVTLWSGAGEGIGFAAQWRRVWRNETRVRWRAAYISSLALALSGGIVWSWAGGYHVLGTDKVGRDVLLESLKSIRTALVIGSLTTFLQLPFSLSLGIAAGYFKGLVDDVVQFVYTTLNSIPSVLLIAAAIFIVRVHIDTHPDAYPTSLQRADVRLLWLCIILGITSWTGLARLLRGESLKLRELEYVQAAQAFGVSSFRIMSAHLARNVMHLAVISLVTDFSGLVLSEAVLSYIGVGVDPTTDSFGTMIDAARLELSREPMVWWSLAAAFVFMLLLVLAANLVADAVRDAFDPRTAMWRPRMPRAARRPAGRAIA